MKEIHDNDTFRKQRSKSVAVPNVLDYPLDV